MPNSTTTKEYPARPLPHSDLTAMNKQWLNTELDYVVDRLNDIQGAIQNVKAKQPRESRILNKIDLDLNNIQTAVTQIGISLGDVQ